MVDVVYIHPFAGLLDNLVIPTGIIPLLNKLDCRKKGVYWFELYNQHIRESKIIALDLHWFYSLYSVYNLCKRCKKINPEVKIILGGYTATLFADILIKEFQCDYIIKGDAEYSFPLLINNILNGTQSKDVPNLVTRHFSTPFSYNLNNEDFDNCDYINVDWFASFKKSRTRHSLYSSRIFIQAIKGCINNCDGCYGNHKLQKFLCRRGLVRRSPKTISKEISEYSDDKHIRSIQVVSDFMNIFNTSELEKIFYKKYDLDLFYYFEKFYDNSAIYNLLSKSFRKVRIFLPIYDIKQSIRTYISVYRLSNILNQFKNLTNFSTVLLIDENITPELIDYLKTNIKYFNSVSIRFGSDFLIKVPMPKDNYEDLYNEYTQYLRISRNKFHNITFRFVIFFYRLEEENSRLGFLLRNLYYYIHRYALFNFFVFKKIKRFLFCYDLS